MKENVNKDEKIPTPEELGIPNGSFDPMQTIRMEGDLYRGLLNARHHSLMLRLMSIIFSTIFFIVPAILILFFVFFGPSSGSLGADPFILVGAVLKPIFFLTNASGLYALKIFMLIYAVISFFVGYTVILLNINNNYKKNGDDK